MGGGAANTAMALARAGAQPVLVSALGRDAAGQWLLRELQAVGVATSWVATEAPTTTRSMVFLGSDGGRTIVNLARAPVVFPADLVAAPADCLYVRSADPSLTPVLARYARHSTVVAHVPPVQAGLRPAQVLVGSADDLDGAFLADPFTAGKAVAGSHLQWVVITRGAAGASAHGAGETLVEKAPEVTVVDSTGAGDVFAAGLLQALGSGEPMATALKRAVAWGAASVRYEGTVPPLGFPDAIRCAGGD